MIQEKSLRAKLAVAAVPPLPHVPFLLSDDVAQFVGTMRARAANEVSVTPLAQAMLRHRARLHSAELGEARKCATALLARLGAPDPVLESNGVLKWPGGFVGSIAVCGARVAVATALRGRVVGIGIDIAAIACAPGYAQNLSAYPDAAQCGPLAAVDRNEATLAAACTSSKESLYKCLQPLVGGDFERESAQVTNVEPVTGTTQITLLHDLSSQFRAGSAFVGRFRCDECYVYTSVELRG